MLTRVEAADILRVNPKTVDALIRKRLLRAVKLTKKCVRIPAESLRQLIKDKTT